MYLELLYWNRKEIKMKNKEKLKSPFLPKVEINVRCKVHAIYVDMLLNDIKQVLNKYDIYEGIIKNSDIKIEE